MQVGNDQRVSSLVDEFEITDTRHVEGEIEFEHDVVDFAFKPNPDTEAVRCCLRLLDYDTFAELTNASVEVDIPEGSSDRHFVSFADFGWYDEGMTMPINRCRYEAWTESNVSIWVEIYA